MSFASGTYLLFPASDEIGQLFLRFLRAKFAGEFFWFTAMFSYRKLKLNPPAARTTRKSKGKDFRVGRPGPGRVIVWGRELAIHAGTTESKILQNHGPTRFRTHSIKQIDRFFREAPIPEWEGALAVRGVSRLHLICAIHLCVGKRQGIV
jgi:hypothetical protein